ncbi:ABC transporter substrate-binding protein [Rothia halotolerans]|uniref:ABC transporter substrate-binding protein n=1 Tax=Rothia halotolerans TaxID=405770 RepID=UPI00101C953D|nr:ABC transporter substrate-binding protein [Rothia halotolerans]
MSKFSTLSKLTVSLLVASTIGLAGCSQGADEASSDSSQSAEQSADRTVSTPKGDVTVPGDPQKVVVLNYALAGYLYDLDVPVTNVVPEDADGDGEFSDMWGDKPEEDGTEFLPWSTEGFDLESIMAAEPDLIIAGGWGFPYFQADEIYDDLSDIAPTVMVDKGFETWQDQLKFLAVDTFGKQDKYDEMLSDYDARIEDVRGNIEVPPQPTSFISVVADGTPYLAFDNSALPELFSDLGFEVNPLTEENNLEPYTQGGDMAELSTEQLGQLVDSETVFVNGFNADTLSVDELKDRPVWQDLPAFQNGHAYDLPYWASRHDYDEAMALLDQVEENFGK